MDMRSVPYLVALAVVLAGFPAVATDLRNLGTYGGWQAYGGLAEDGKRVCGIEERGNDGRSIHFKYFDGDDYLTAQIFKDAWSIPKNTSIPMQMQFGAFSPWTIPGLGIGKLIEFRIDSKQLPQFTLEFRAASDYSLTFMNGTEGSWSGSLSGSGAAIDRLLQCMGVMTQTNSPPSTQPFSSGPSQPFDVTPQSRPPAKPAVPTGQQQRL